MNFDDQLDLIRGAAEFDAEWYSKKYQDVAMLDADPACHFLRYGLILERSPGPAFDTEFYLKTYQSSPAAKDINPLIDYLLAEDRSHRSVDAQSLAAEMRVLREAMCAVWADPQVAPSESRKISYCIPVMGRLDDIVGTLESNLAENSSVAGDIEFLVVEFGEQRDVREWIEQNFPKELADGYLRIVSDRETLDTWHFGKAKNAFRPYLRGEVYSSLDADNYVSVAETRQLLDILDAYPDGFVFHHFSGEWGDGTSGRVSMLASMYRSVGYDSQLLPRQFDEIDFIFGALRQFPAAPFINVNAEKNLFTQSMTARNFFQDEKLPNRRISVENHNRKAPLNPRGAGYTSMTPYLRDMGNFNAKVSSSRRSISLERQQKYIEAASKHKYELLQSMPRELLLGTLFTIATASSVPKVKQSDICLFACVHDEEHFLPKFVDHYRKLGVTKFFFVDDNSKVAVSQLKLGRGVYTFRPKVGEFRTAKTLWLEALIRVFVPEGGWVVTVDADEFIQVPEPFANLMTVVKDLEKKDVDFAPGLLLDLVPGDLGGAGLGGDVQGSFYELFDSFCFRTSAPSEAYINHSSVRWGFGPYARVSWAVDTRFHAFKTFDSLRKFPLFRHRVNRHLNQGFHTFHHLDRTPPPGHDIWKAGPILPIFHYKLVRLFSEASRKKMLEMSSGYHTRTNENISRIFGAPSSEAVGELSLIARDLLPLKQALTLDFFKSLYDFTL